jgi:ankyrin repeat protein
VEQLSALAAIGPRPGEVILKAVRAHNTASVGKLLATRSSLVAARDRSSGMTLLHIAAASGFDDLVATLLAAHANLRAVDRIGRTPLHYAVEARHLETTKLLLAAGADVAACGDGGWTPLSPAAAGDGENPCGPLLLEAKADPNDAGREGADTPLEMAAMNNHVGLVTALLQHGANPKFATKDGRTALHGAQPACAELLIARGADVNALGPEGTPLHCRVNQEDLAGVESLVAHGANVNATNHEGRTPLDLAREAAKGAEADPARVAGYQKLIDFLLEHGAKPGKPVASAAEAGRAIASPRLSEGPGKRSDPVSFRSVFVYIG